MAIDERGVDVCVFCEFRDLGYGSAVSGDHAPDCLHEWAKGVVASWDRAEWKPRAVVVTLGSDPADAGKWHPRDGNISGVAPDKPEGDVAGD